MSGSLQIVPIGDPKNVGSYLITVSIKKYVSSFFEAQICLPQLPDLLGKVFLTSEICHFASDVYHHLVFDWPIFKISVTKINMIPSLSLTE